MATHKTKSFEIDAWQYTKDLKKLPAWAKDKVKQNKEGEVVVTLPDSTEIVIELDWWIIKDQHGNIISMPNAAFENNYDDIKPLSNKVV